jgi:hypothetical protein
MESGVRPSTAYTAELTRELDRLGYELAAFAAADAVRQAADRLADELASIEVDLGRLELAQGGSHLPKQ